MSAWDNRLGHLEVVHGLPGQGYPPGIESDMPAEDAVTVDRKPLLDGSPTPPFPRTQHRAQPSFINPDKNPTQLLIEFYSRFKGQRDVSFEHIVVDEANEQKLWCCTINLSGGRINDHKNLVACSFQAQDRSKKGAEAAASKAALEHLASLGLANSQTLTAQSNKQNRWALPRRRLQDSELVCFELSAEPEAGPSHPCGQIVVELFHDVAPQTLANLKRYFGLCHGQHLAMPPISPAQHACHSGASNLCGSDSQGNSDGHHYISHGQSIGCGSGSSNEESGNCGSGCSSKESGGDSSGAHVVSSRNNGSASGAGCAQQQGNGYVGCQLLYPVTRGCLTFSPPCSVYCPPWPPHTDVVGSGGRDSAGCDGSGGCSGSDGDKGGGGAPKAAAAAEDAVMADALARLLGMQEGGNGGITEEENEDGEETAGEEAGAVKEGQPCGKGSPGDVHQEGQAFVSHKQQQQQQQQPEAQQPEHSQSPPQERPEQQAGGYQEQEELKHGEPLPSCIVASEAHAKTQLLRHDRPFRVSLLLDASTMAESAALNIMVPPLAAFNETHFVVGQVVHGFGIVRQMEACAAGQDVVHGIYSQALSHKDTPPKVYRISNCWLLPPAANLEELPVLMDGEWPTWPEDLPPAPPGMPEAQWRLSMTDALRTAANTAFKEGAWAAAAHKYTHALRYLNLKSLNSLDAIAYTHKQEMQDMRCRTLLNRSAAAVRLGQGLAAMADARAVLDLCPEEHGLVPKALFRLGQSLMAVGRHEEALGTLRKALQLTGPSSTDIRNAIGQAKQLLKQQREREGRAYAKALQGWSREAAKKGGKEVGCDDERAWLLNSKAESILERLGGDAPFRGISMV